MGNKKQPTKLDGEYNAALVALKAFEQLTRDDPVSLESSVVGLTAALREVARRAGFPFNVVEARSLILHRENCIRYNREINARTNPLVRKLKEESR